MEVKVGDIVARKSYKNDLYFKITEITERSGQPKAKLRALDVRLMADSPLEDLVKVTSTDIRVYRKDFITKHNQAMAKISAGRIQKQTLDAPKAGNRSSFDFFEMPGRVLHIDGTAEYLNLCLNLYQQLGIKADGLHISEGDQPASVPALIKKYNPDILVLTGHDGLLKSTEDYGNLDNYHNSKHFVEAVKAARAIQSDLDSLIIFAGACQSQYELLLSAGANYASSPKRIFIHAFDPVLIVEKVALTHISEIIELNEVIHNTTTGPEGIGGIETRGKLRRGFPKTPYSMKISINEKEIYSINV